MWPSHMTVTFDFHEGPPQIFRGSSAVQVKCKNPHSQFHQSCCPRCCGFPGVTSEVVFRGSSVQIFCGFSAVRLKCCILKGAAHWLGGFLKHFLTSEAFIEIIDFTTELDPMGIIFDEIQYSTILFILNLVEKNDYPPQ